MWAASLGTVLVLLVVVSSIIGVRRWLSYETWHLLHLWAYAGMGLALPHQLVGRELGRGGTGVYWWGLYLFTLAASCGSESLSRSSGPGAARSGSIESPRSSRESSRSRCPAATSTSWACGRVSSSSGGSSVAEQACAATRTPSRRSHGPSLRMTI